MITINFLYPELEVQICPTFPLYIGGFFSETAAAAFLSPPMKKKIREKLSRRVTNIISHVRHQKNRGKKAKQQKKFKSFLFLHLLPRDTGTPIFLN